jgi:hypothetical protein
MSELRKIQRVDSGKLTTVQMQDLKVGDVFVMFDVEDGVDHQVGFFKARELPRLDNGVWGIVADDDLNW